MKVNFGGIKWAAALALAWVGIGCGGEGGGNQLPKPVILFLNVSPDSGNLQFSVNDTNVGGPLAYTQSTGDFTTIEDVTDEDGGSDVKVTDADTGTELERDSQVFQRDNDILCIAYGLQNPGAEFEKRLQQLIIGINRRPVTGKARLYILNAFLPRVGVSPRQINFQNVDPNDPLSNSRPLYSRNNLVYGAFADSSILDVDPGTITFQARASDSDAIVVLAQTTYTFEAGRIYLTIVGGQETNSDVNRQGRVLVFPLTTK